MRSKCTSLVKRKTVIFVAGPTGSVKTALLKRLAERATSYLKMAASILTWPSDQGSF